MPFVPNFLRGGLGTGNSCAVCAINFQRGSRGNVICTAKKLAISNYGTNGIAQRTNRGLHHALIEVCTTH